MKTMVVDDARIVPELQQEWEELHDDSASDALFATWVWCDTWLRHFGAESELRIILARDQSGRLLGIAPLELVRRRTAAGMTLRQLQFIGAKAPVEHFDLILRHGVERDVLAALLGEMRRMSFDRLFLANLLPHSPSLPLLRAGNIPFEESDGHVTPVLALPRTMEEVHRRQEARKRTNVRYAMRRAAREHEGNWSCDVAAAGETASAFDDLVRLHQQQWESRGEPGAFADARLTSFYRALAERFAARGWLRMYRLQVNGDVVSANFAIVFRRRFHHFINGTDYQSPIASPGTVLHACMIEKSIAEDVQQYDFMWGEESYKYDWGAERHVDRTLTWNRSFRAKLLDRGSRLLRVLRRTRSS